MLQKDVSFQNSSFPFFFRAMGYKYNYTFGNSSYFSTQISLPRVMASLKLVLKVHCRSQLPFFIAVVLPKRV